MRSVPKLGEAPTFCAARGLLNPLSNMKVFRTEKQRKNVAKFFRDMAKVALTFFLIGPLAKPETVSWPGLASGFLIGFTLSWLEVYSRRQGRETMNPFTPAFFILGSLVVVGLIIVVLDRYPKRPDKSA